MTEIAASSRLEGDLRLDSLEFAIFGELLRTRFGDAVDLGTFLSDLDIDAVIGLTVTDVAVYVEQRGTPAQRAPQPPRSPQGES